MVAESLCTVYDINQSRHVFKAPTGVYLLNTRAFRHNLFGGLHFNKQPSMESYLALIIIITLAFYAEPIVGDVPVFSDDGLSVECSAKPGDILLGFLTTIRSQGSDSKHRCSDLTFSTAMQIVETFSFAITLVNQRHDLLKNITLGYVILDTCYSNSPLAALGRSQYFVGHERHVASIDCSQGVDKFNVAGVVGPITSSETVLTASYLGFHEVPSVGFTATSDEL